MRPTRGENFGELRITTVHDESERSGPRVSVPLCLTFVEPVPIIEGMPASIGFRPTPEDERILREAARPGEKTSDTLRRALRLLDHERWLEKFREDAETLRDEDLNAEPDAW